MRNGLSQKNKDKSSSSGKESSRLTMFRRGSLRGRFKLNNEQKAETKKQDGAGPSRPLSKRQASSSVISESDSQAETLAEAEAEAETQAETEVAGPSSRGREVVAATHQEALSPPLVRAPGPPDKTEPHHNCASRRLDPFISICEFCLAPLRA